jgi:hypothetical protein
MTVKSRYGASMYFIVDKKIYYNSEVMNFVAGMDNNISHSEYLTLR